MSKRNTTSSKGFSVPVLTPHPAVSAGPRLYLPDSTPSEPPRKQPRRHAWRLGGRPPRAALGRWCSREPPGRCAPGSGGHQRRAGRLSLCPKALRVCVLPSCRYPFGRQQVVPDASQLLGFGPEALNRTGIEQLFRTRPVPPEGTTSVLALESLYGLQNPAVGLGEGSLDVLQVLYVAIGFGVVGPVAGA